LKRRTIAPPSNLCANKLCIRVLQIRDCLWNSFVMVASVPALLELIEGALPELSFACLAPFLGSRVETRTISKLYERIE
jgi:hypothetical protein